MRRIGLEFSLSYGTEIRYGRMVLDSTWFVLKMVQKFAFGNKGVVIRGYLIKEGSHIFWDIVFW